MVEIFTVKNKTKERNTLEKCAKKTCGHSTTTAWCQSKKILNSSHVALGRHT